MDKALRVLLINTLYYPYSIGGAEKSVQLLAEGLAGRGHDVSVLTLSEENFTQVKCVNGVRVFYLPISNLFWPFSNEPKGRLVSWLWHFVDLFNLFAAFQVARLLDEIKPDVVHTNNLAGFSVSVWWAVKRRRIRLVHTARDYYLFDPGATLYNKGSALSLSSARVRCWSFFKKKASAKVDFFIGISDFITKIHLQSGFFPGKPSKVVFNSVVSVKSFAGDDGLGGELRLGYIGRIDDAKGYENFVSFVCNQREKFSERYRVSAVVAGRGDSKYIASVHSKYNMDGFENLGYVDLYKFLEKVDHVVLPVNWEEPFGRVAIECALAGKKVWVSKKGGLKELVRYHRLINFTDDFHPVFLPDKFVQEYDFTVDFLVDKYLDVYAG